MLLVFRYLLLALGAAAREYWAATLRHAERALLLEPDRADALRFKEAALRGLGLPPSGDHMGVEDAMSDEETVRESPVERSTTQTSSCHQSAALET